MAAVPLRALLQHLRRIVGPRSGGLTDAHLLERFVNERDEAAFEVLVWRHGPMVLSMCRRMLRQEQDAEDAFQATFLTFVRKARSIGKREAVAGWLYKVAYRIALEAKTLASKRRVREKQEAGTLEAIARQPATDSTVWRDLRAVLDEEVNRLPEKYRTPLILCYFEGKTYEEAAREIGCPKGTVSIRLMRARELLRPRLARRGLGLPGGILAAVLSENTTAAAVSKSLVEGTVKAALLFAAGKTAAGVLSGQAVALTEGVLKTMFMTKLKIAAGLLLALGVVGSGAGVLSYRGIAGERRSPQAETLLTPLAIEPQEHKEKSAPPSVRAKEDKRKLRPAEAARGDLDTAEMRYQELEHKWTKELVAARLRMMRAEDQLKMTERERDPTRELDQLKAAQNAYRQAQQTLPKDHPRIKEFQEAFYRVQERWNEYIGRRALLLAQVREEFVVAEEELRLIERLQSIQREKALRNPEAAEERVRRLQELSPRADPPIQTLELERKLDRLFREIAELRREIRRQSADKGTQPSPERRPDQP